MEADPELDEGARLDVYEDRCGVVVDDEGEEEGGGELRRSMTDCSI
jgi:hypothetical protein